MLKKSVIPIPHPFNETVTFINRSHSILFISLSFFLVCFPFDVLSITVGIIFMVSLSSHGLLVPSLRAEREFVEVKMSNKR